MIKRDSTVEEVHELAYSAIWREFMQSTCNAECDYLAQQLGDKLMVVVEQFIDTEHERRERLKQEVA